MDAALIVILSYCVMIPVVAGLTSRFDRDPDVSFSVLMGVMWPVILATLPFICIYWLFAEAGRK